jgi:hypothetical protein
MPVKTYVLLPHTKPTAPIYQRVNKDQRVRLDKRPVDHAYLKQTFTTPDGKNRTARLKLSCNTIWQDEQIKPDIGIPANEQFTQAERDAVKFVNEINMVRNETVQTYLESIPQWDGWEGWKKDEKGNQKGYSEERPLYTLLDKELISKSTNEEFKKRLRAANKVAAIEDLKEGQNLMIRLNGRSFTPPNDLIDLQNALIEFVDDATDEMLDALLKDETSADEKVIILISRAISEGIISFDAVKDQVSKKKGDGWLSVKNVSSTYSAEERERYFAEFLTSEDGKLLRSDLEKEVEKNEKKVSNTKK